jgi:hypothetical protein
MSSLPPDFRVYGDPKSPSFWLKVQEYVNRILSSAKNLVAELAGHKVDVGAHPEAFAAHKAEVDPHPGYLTEAEGDERYALAGSVWPVGYAEPIASEGEIVFDEDTGDVIMGWVEEVA